MKLNWDRLLWSVPAVIAAGVTSAPSALLMTQDQALQLAFSNGESVTRITLYLNASDQQRIEKIAKSKLETAVINYYVGLKDGRPTGYALFSTHIVRTMPETLMVVLNPDGTVRFVEILAFYEPDDYKAPSRWLKLFSGKNLDDDLWVKRGLRNITGATLTAQAVTEAVRRTLAIYNDSIGISTTGAK